MVTLSRIYTRTGDKGTTALGNGTRVAKHDLRVESYGTVDELNSTLGLARLHATDDAEYLNTSRIDLIQNDLFDLGADLCRPDRDKDADAEYPPLRMIAAQTERLEREIDEMNKNLAVLKSFILPGGTALAAHLHLSRTVARRAERLCTALAEVEDVNPEAIRYLNRLSDWCFVAARVANGGGARDILWQPGASRDA